MFIQHKGQFNPDHKLDFLLDFHDFPCGESWSSEEEPQSFLSPQPLFWCKHQDIFCVITHKKVSKRSQNSLTCQILATLLDKFIEICLEFVWLHFCPVGGSWEASSIFLYILGFLHKTVNMWDKMSLFNNQVSWCWCSNNTDHCCNIDLWPLREKKGEAKGDFYFGCREEEPLQHHRQPRSIDREKNVRQETGNTEEPSGQMADGKALVLFPVLKNVSLAQITELWSCEETHLGIVAPFQSLTLTRRERKIHLSDISSLTTEMFSQVTQPVIYAKKYNIWKQFESLGDSYSRLVRLKVELSLSHTSLRRCMNSQL